jgi:transposase
MSYDISSLPNDIQSLKRIVLSQQADLSNTEKMYQDKLEKQQDEIIYQKKNYENRIASREKEYESKIKEFENQISYLEEQQKMLKKILFGKRREKLTAKEVDQMLLFNEMEETIALQEDQQVVVKEHKRRGKRKKISGKLPRLEIVHDLKEEEKIHSCGRKMKEIKRISCEKIRLIPQQIVVEKHVQILYGCECEGVDTEGVESALKLSPMPPQIIPKSLATPSLLAYILTSKFNDALPFYRQEKIFDRLGIEISRQTLCRWAMMIHDKCRPLLNLMVNEIRSGPLIAMDESPMRVLKDENNEKVTKNHYIWVSRGGPLERPVLWYEHHPDRSSEYVKEFLEGYKGYVQCDGYSAYEFLDDEPGIKVAGCWAHARRRFYRVRDHSRNKSSGLEGLRYIKELYRIEREAENMKPEERQKVRQEKSVPVLTGFKKWLDKKRTQVPPKSLMGDAVNYTLNQWKRLQVFLEDGRIRIDNNLDENAVRPYVLGRKNWLFSDKVQGAKASAGLYSIIETAKANGLDPYWYLLYLFEKLPEAKTEEACRSLLPNHVDEKDLKSPF